MELTREMRELFASMLEAEWERGRYDPNEGANLASLADNLRLYGTLQDLDASDNPHLPRHLWTEEERRTADMADRFAGHALRLLHKRLSFPDILTRHPPVFDNAEGVLRIRMPLDPSQVES